MTGRLQNVSPEVQQEIAALLAKGDTMGADRRLSRYRSNEERAYLIQMDRSAVAASSSQRADPRLLIVFIMLAIAAVLVVWLKLRH